MQSPGPGSASGCELLGRRGTRLRRGRSPTSAVIYCGPNSDSGAVGRRFTSRFPPGSCASSSACRTRAEPRRRRRTSQHRSRDGPRTERRGARPSNEDGSPGGLVLSAESMECFSWSGAAAVHAFCLSGRVLAAHCTTTAAPLRTFSLSAAGA